MKSDGDRREFLSDLGRGMVIASVGAGLARVTASMHGYDRKDSHGHWAPGYEQACKLLGVRA